MKGRWDLSLLAKNATQMITQEFRANSTDKTLIFALPMNDDSQSHSFPRGYRESGSVCTHYLRKTEDVPDNFCVKFIKDVRLRLNSHQDFHTAISFLSKDAGLRHIDDDQHDSSFTLKRPHSQTAFSASQPAPGFHGSAVPRPQSVMLPPSRLSSQVSNRLASQGIVASHHRRHGLSMSQEYGVHSGQNHSSRPTLHQTHGSFNQGVQLYHRPRLTPSPGGSFVDSIAPFSHRPQPVVPLQQQSINAGNYRLTGRLQGYGGMLNGMHEEDSHAMPIRNSQQLRQHALSWQSDEGVGPHNADVIYSDTLQDELGDYTASALRTQRQQSIMTRDTTPNVASPDILESDWMSATVTHSPAVAAPKRPGPHYIRPLSVVKKLRQTTNAIDSQTAEIHQPPMQSNRVTDGIISPRRRRASKATAARQINSHSQHISGSIEDAELASSSCMRCRRKHLQCDRVLPTCSACASDDLICVAFQERNAGNSAGKETPEVRAENSQVYDQTSFTTSMMQDSGVQFETTTQDGASQTLTSKGSREMANAETNTSTTLSDKAMQTDVVRTEKLGIEEWAELMISIRTMGNQQVVKGARWLQCSTGLPSEYEQRLFAAASCGTELVDGLIDLVENAVKGSN